MQLILTKYIQDKPPIKFSLSKIISLFLIEFMKVKIYLIFFYYKKNLKDYF